MLTTHCSMPVSVYPGFQSQIKKLFYSFLLLASALGFSSDSSAQTQAQFCAALSGHTLNKGLINNAELVHAGAFAAASNQGAEIYSTLPAFCRVEASLTPVPGSDIKIEVWLPAGNWNNKLVAVGNGGFAGSIGHAALAGAVREGYAAVSTDTGHAGNNPEFLFDDEKLTDFAHRAVHEMTVAAKAIAAEYYPSDLRFTYFNGCSTGGRQALTAAQLYPNDFDGIIAGAAANSTVRMTTQQLWSGRAVIDNPAAALTSEQFVALNEAVIAACDALDGVSDGVIENPLACTVGPELLDSLDPAQREAVHKIYGGAINPVTGQQIFPGFARGSEHGWTMTAGGEPFGYSDNIHKYLINRDENWNFRDLDFSRDLAELDERINALGMQAIDADLTPFFSQGGKLLMYHGWNDPGISPFNIINYYNNVLATTGSQAADSIRLFMMPGVNHCRGGNGTDTWQQLQVLDSWVESGLAPERIEAARLNDGVVDKTRPLCAYPQIAVYRGSGDINDATNFECGTL